MRLPRPVVMPSDASSTTASKSAAVKLGVGGGPAHQARTAPSSFHSSAAATSATICWARMSRGATGGQVASRRPARTAASRAAHSTSSSRVRG